MPTPIFRSRIVSPPVLVNSTSTVLIGCASNPSSFLSSFFSTGAPQHSSPSPSPPILPPPPPPSSSSPPPPLFVDPVLLIVNGRSLLSLFDNAIAASENSQ